MSRPKQKRRPSRHQQRARARRSARNRRNLRATEPLGACPCGDCHPTESLLPESVLSDMEPAQFEPGQATWVPPGKQIFVQGRWIEAGMVYVGSGAPSANGYWIEPCLIDPDLPVDWRHPDRSGRTLDAWPSYDSASPRARAAFLEWLAGGRADERTSIGYVLMFFFGLERRLFFDIGSDLSHPDVPTIGAEILRLAAIYGHDETISAHAFSLLCLLEALAFREADVPAGQAALDETGWRSNLTTLVGLGKLVADGSKIPPDWALSYLYHHPETNLRTSAQRCPTEFDELFMARYRTRYRGGMKIRRPAHDLRIGYDAASHGFRGFTIPSVHGLMGDERLGGDFEFGYGGTVEIALDGIPDVSLLTAPIRRLWKLARECADELDAYSRFIGKHPDRARSAAAMCLLPDVLLEARGGPILDDLRDWAAEKLSGGPTSVVAMADLLERWSPGHPGKLTAGEAKSLATLLGRLGVGIEPDVRFGAPTPKPGGSAVLFPLPDGAGDAPSDAYAAAKPLLHLAAVVAGADGLISPSRLSFAVDYVGQKHSLNAAERRRAGAHMEFLATGRLGMYGVKGKVEAILPESRAGVGGFLVALAMSDGAATPKQITALEKMFGHLGLDDAELYRQLHGLHLDDPLPVTLRNTQSAPRWAIPDAESSARPTSPGALDAEKVRVRLAETARVSAFLEGIFTDENPAEAAPAPADPDFGSTIEALDRAHRRLLSAMAAEPEWERRAAEEMAVSFGLPMLDGALDVINEISMDTCGEPVVEGFDPVVLNPYAVKELC
ncbi:MAG: TerB N-terminal domain-containing protein [bacterium]|nr:TerB N-terminal domain-containing protein [bacterium]